ncbi:MAG: TetR/AcrR family transcriptional regulator [Mycobacterium sp.]
MSTVTPTRERLVTEAMRLFSTYGYQAASISQIESAAGLTAGSGALYHHFKSKEALLEAGINRQLDRRQAMSDIRALFAGLGNLHAELTVLGRYLNTVLTQEFELIQIASRTPVGQSTLLDTAYRALIDGLTAELTDWITAWTPSSSPDQIRVLSALALNSILGLQLARSLDEDRTASLPADYLTEWTCVLVTRIQALTNVSAGGG